MAAKPTKEGEKIIDFPKDQCIYHFCLIVFEIHVVLLIVSPFHAAVSAALVQYDRSVKQTHSRDVNH